MYHYRRIRDLREDKDMNQKTIAEILGITSQQYSLYARGGRKIPLHHAITQAKFYYVSLNHIAELANQKQRL